MAAFSLGATFALHQKTLRTNVSKGPSRPSSPAIWLPSRADFDDFRNTWIKFLENLDPASELARRTKDKIARIPDQINVFIEP